MLMALLLAGCGAQSVKDEVVASAQTPDPAVNDVMEIKEKMLIAQVNEIYVNSADYLGEQIRYEGCSTSTPITTQAICSAR